MGEINITIKADDLSGQKLEDVADRVRGVGDAGENAGRQWEAWGRSVNTMTHTLQHGMSIMTRLDLVQITVQQSTDRVALSQQKYNDALNEFGAGSPQVIQAHRELENAQSSLEKTNLRARMSYVLVAGEIVTLTARMPLLINSMNAYAASTNGATAATVRFGAALLPIVAAVAGGALLGGQLSKLVGPEDVNNIAKGADGLSRLTNELEQIEKHRSDHPIMAMLGDESNVFGWIPGVETGTERIKNLKKAIEDLKGSSGPMGPILPDWWAKEQQDAADKVEKDQKDTAAAIAKAWTDNMNMVGGSLQHLGVDFQNLSTTTTAEIGAISPELAKLAGAALRVQASDEQLARTMLQSANPAIRAQATVTREKGEKTEDLRRRLVALGFHEDEVAGKVDDATESFSLQTRATKEAASSMMVGASLAAGLGMASVNRNVVAQGMDSGAAGSTLDALYRKAEQNPSIRGSNDYEYARQVLDAILQGRGSNTPGGANMGNFMLNRSLQQLGVTPAAGGFDGDVTGPRLFLAGESGREHVSITPGGGGGMGNVSLTAIINGNAQESDVRRGLMGALRDFTIVQKRIASRRSY